MSRFFEEAKRRNVYRVAAAYIIGAAGVIQMASAAFPAWELPKLGVALGDCPFAPRFSCRPYPWLGLRHYRAGP